MAQYTVEGNGVQILTSGTDRIFIDVLLMPPGVSVGNAFPPNYYGVGLLRFGINGYYDKAFAIDGTSIWLDLPTDVNEVGYAVREGGQIRISEETPPPPLTTYVATSLDGASGVTGDPVNITFARGDAPNTGDWVGLVDTSWDISFGRAFGYFDTNGSHSVFPYTSSGSDTPGSSGVQTGTFAGVLRDPFGTTATVHAVYVDGNTGAILASGPTFSFSP